MHVSFSESVITLLRTRFGNEINVRIYGVVAGSQLQGPLQELSELEYGDFKIILLEDSLVKECEKNTFINTYQTGISESRDSDVFTYYTPRTGEDIDPITIKAFEIQQTKKQCIKTTVLEYCKPCQNDTYCYEWDGCYGSWDETKASEFVSEISLDSKDKYFTFQTDQVGYMEKLAPTFAPGSDALYLPDFVTIKARFRTFDEATKLTINDVFYIEIWGSDETFTDFCNYEDLSIEAGTNMIGSRVVEIISDEEQTWEPEEFFLTTQISGLDEFRMLNPNCASLMYMTVEARLPS